MLKIIKVPDPVLTRKTTPIEKIDQEILDLAEDMLTACRKANGVGLAAPQIGKSIRLCIINLEHIGIPPFALVNPKLSNKSFRKIEMEEGCLSIPGIYGIVKRPKSITVKAQAVDGKQLKFKADGLLARVIQHEVDHLDGILFTSKMIRQTTGKQDEKM
jgi:peptide deformylase